VDLGDIGRAKHSLVQNEREEAVRVLEGAWERGRGGDVSRFVSFRLLSLVSMWD
jgi:hypothetical protein